MRKIGRKVLSLLLLLTLAVTVLHPVEVSAATSTEIKLNTASATMAPATTKTLTLKNASGKITWQSNKSSVASVSSTGVVTAKKPGTAVITATHKSVKYKCTIKVTYQTKQIKDGMKYKDVSDAFGRSGRWFQKSFSGKKYWFTNTEGSCIYFKVVGTRYINVSFVSQYHVATPMYAYSIDGNGVMRKSIKDTKIDLGNTKTHYVRLMVDAIDENESRWSKEDGVGIKKISAETKGGVITGIKPVNGTIAFYGDSITQGVRALSKSLSPAGTSACHSFAWYAAKELDMVPYYAGYGGSGIGQSGCFSTASNAVSKFSASRGAAKFEAEIVVIEHGTNDVNMSSSSFESGYRSLVQKIHAAQPKAQILAMIPLKQGHAGEIRKVAQSYKYVTAVETSGWGISVRDTPGHPDVDGAKKMGSKLAAIAKKYRKTVVR